MEENRKNLGSSWSELDYTLKKPIYVPIINVIKINTSGYIYNGYGCIAVDKTGKQHLMSGIKSLHSFVKIKKEEK